MVDFKKVTDPRSISAKNWPEFTNISLLIRDRGSLSSFLRKRTQGPPIFLNLPLIRNSDFHKVDQKVRQNEGFYYY